MEGEEDIRTLKLSFLLLLTSGVVDYLTTEVSTSKQKKFPFVIFIDTPGLVDGDMKYPFDVDKTLIWLGGIADLILVFFDPLGQALCKRTLDIVGEYIKKTWYLSTPSLSLSFPPFSFQNVLMKGTQIVLDSILVRLIQLEHKVIDKEFLCK